MDFSPGVRDGSGTGQGSVVDDLNFQSFNDIVKNSVHVDGDSDSESDDYDQDFPRMNNSSSDNFDYRGLLHYGPPPYMGRLALTLP